MTDNIIRYKLSKIITSLSLDKEELKRFLVLLQERSITAYELECKKLGAITDDSYDTKLVKVNLKDGFNIMVTVTGYEGKELSGSIDEVFNSASFPEKVNSVYVHSELPYRSQFNHSLDNFFELWMDFSKSNVFDFTIQPNEKTPNGSYFRVEGSDNTWVSGVFHEIVSELNSKRSKFKVIHKGSASVLSFWLLGIPFGFWTCYKFSNFIDRTFSLQLYLKAALLLYMFFISLFVFLILFRYFRWVYPMIEYKNRNERSVAHQAALLSIILGIIGKMLYDLLKYIFAW